MCGVVTTTMVRSCSESKTDLLCSPKENYKYTNDATVSSRWKIHLRLREQDPRFSCIARSAAWGVVTQLTGSPYWVCVCVCVVTVVSGGRPGDDAVGRSVRQLSTLLHQGGQLRCVFSLRRVRSARESLSDSVHVDGSPRARLYVS